MPTKPPSVVEARRNGDDVQRTAPTAHFKASPEDLRLDGSSLLDVAVAAHRGSVRIDAVRHVVFLTIQADPG